MYICEGQLNPAAENHRVKYKKKTRMTTSICSEAQKNMDGNTDKGFEEHLLNLESC